MGGARPANRRGIVPETSAETARLIIRHYCQRCLSRRMTVAITIVPSTAPRVAGPWC
jgi:hypothetical protein